MTTRQGASSLLAGLALAAGGVIAGSTVADVTPGGERGAVGPDVQEALAVGEYIGPCAIVTPPEPDPCQAVQGTIAYAFLGNLVNAAPYKSWKKGAPGEMSRLAGIMLSPQCSTASNPQPQTMRTFMGAALADAISAYGCARGQGPIFWPPTNPPPIIGSQDTTPPSAPGLIQITPNG